ncbi:mCG148441 [Mus musculus]|nr:mCG148441 [Mus musculus]
MEDGSEGSRPKEMRPQELVRLSTRTQPRSLHGR